MSVERITHMDVEELILAHPEIAHFGSEAYAVDDGWVKKAEDALGVVFSDSYKWFLKKYAGGEIGSEEIYSIYGKDFATVNGGDIVFKYISGIKNKTTERGKIVVSETDYGEVFFFDSTGLVGGEYPIKLRLPSGKVLEYAADFYEFLYKRVHAYLP
ncbi:MAG: SMI1/KNR4 family protein [Rhodospirillaceae bacterium]|nr:SMI1/KNR4 family protein [Rhodospirillales bacterium]